MHIHLGVFLIQVCPPVLTYPSYLGDIYGTEYGVGYLDVNNNRLEEDSYYHEHNFPPICLNALHTKESENL